MLHGPNSAQIYGCNFQRFSDSVYGNVVGLTTILDQCQHSSCVRVCVCDCLSSINFTTMIAIMMTERCRNS